jgi:hypothetical protein
VLLINATSSLAGAKVWQFMPLTAKEYGMEVTDEVDERISFNKIDGSLTCKYLIRNTKEKWVHGL